VKERKGEREKGRRGQGRRGEGEKGRRGNSNQILYNE
jgi:hypothetical protein